MKIGVDAREIQSGVITGIGRSLKNFIEYFGKNEKEHKLILFSEKLMDTQLDGNIEQIIIKPCQTFLWDQIKLPKALKTNKVNIFYSPYYKIPLLTNVPVVNQILDLMWFGFPPYKESLSYVEKLYYATFGIKFAKKSINIITDSEHAKNDIAKFWKINSHKIKVIPLGLADRYAPVNDARILNNAKTQFHLPQKYILYLGNFKPHKNVKSLIKAFKLISDEISEYKLVLAGTLDQHGKDIQSLTHEMGFKDKVIFTDTIRENDFPEALLSLADLFVFPSLYEGFGLPPLEAMACGTPVIASNVTSIPEVVGDSGILVEPTNVEAMSIAIRDLLKDSQKRKFYSNKGLDRAKSFREKETTARLYKHIISLLEAIK
jgi:glycosyltransferase involved in cell wall biosynthesis